MTLPQKYTDVHSLKDANRWLEHNIAVALQCAGDQLSLTQLAGVVHSMSITSAFSGIGSAETVVLGTCRALQSFLGENMEPPPNLWCMELNPQCQDELSKLPHPPRCRFLDITTGINDKVKAVLLAEGGRMTYEDLKGIFTRSTKRHIMSSSMWCHQHGRLCTLTQGHIHVAGTPCVAWSNLGLQIAVSGATALAFWSWIAHRRLLQENFIVHENVPTFNADVLIDLLGEFYALVDSLVLNASDYGQPYERSRRITILRHKRTILEKPSAAPCYPDFCDLCKRNCYIDWTHYFMNIEENDDLRDVLTQELAWSSSRPSSKRNDGEGHNDFHRALSSIEQSWVEEYRSMCPNGIVDLSQNPGTRPHMSNKSSLQCITSHVGILWSMQHNRWLTGLELLAVHNFPVFEELSFFGVQCSFNQRKAGHVALLERSPSRVRHQVGNSMSLAVMHVVMMWIWFDQVCSGCQYGTSSRLSEVFQRSGSKRSRD